MAEWNLQETENAAHRIEAYRKQRDRKPQPLAPLVREQCDQVEKLSAALDRLARAQGEAAPGQPGAKTALSSEDAFILGKINETRSNLLNDIQFALTYKPANSPASPRILQLSTSLIQAGDPLSLLYTAWAGAPGYYAHHYQQEVKGGGNHREVLNALRPYKNVPKNQSHISPAMQKVQADLWGNNGPSTYGPGVSSPEAALCAAAEWIRWFIPLDRESAPKRAAEADSVPTGILSLADKPEDSTFDAFLAKQGVYSSAGGFKTLGKMAKDEKAGKGHFLGIIPLLAIIAVSGFLLSFGTPWIILTVVLIVIKVLAMLPNKNGKSQNDMLEECMACIPAYNASRQEAHQQALQRTWSDVLEQAKTDKATAKRVRAAEEAAARIGEDIATLADAMRACAEATSELVKAVEEADTVYAIKIRQKADQMHRDLLNSGLPLSEDKWDQFDDILKVMHDGRARTLYDAQNVIIADERAEEEALRNEQFRSEMRAMAQDQLKAQQEATEAAQQAARSASEAQKSASKAAAAGRSDSASDSPFPPIPSCRNCAKRGTTFCLHPGQTHPCGSYMPLR